MAVLGVLFEENDELTRVLNSDACLCLDEVLNKKIIVSDPLLGPRLFWHARILLLECTAVGQWFFLLHLLTKSCHDFNKNWIYNQTKLREPSA